MTTSLCRAEGLNATGGEARIETLEAVIAFDGSPAMGER